MDEIMSYLEVCAEHGFPRRTSAVVSFLNAFFSIFFGIFRFAASTAAVDRLYMCICMRE